MKISVLDSATLGEDLALDPLKKLGETFIYKGTTPSEVEERIKDCDVVVINKVKLNESNLKNAKNLKVICIAATGYDNVDIAYCKKANIGVCNVVGYSSNSVAQVTVATVLSLVCHMNEHTECVKTGKYTQSGVANSLTPVYHEISGKTWGIIGYGNIGKQVGRVANALGCKVIFCRKNPNGEEACVSIDELVKQSDIITIHTPLNDSTKNLLNAKLVSMLKQDAIVVNEARGAVWDEQAIANAISEKMISGMGADVYSTEPFGEDHPFYKIKENKNVCLTPHMAWGAYESRVRCLNEIVENIKAFYNGEIRCRVDLQ